MARGDGRVFEDGHVFLTVMASHAGVARAFVGYSGRGEGSEPSK